jgi:BirA family biotin operon repressor/biotin-[acetyl-CoA-carboxylase] ligase
MPLLPLLAGLALARGLETLGARAELKWPNDLLLEGRKVSGILAESRGTGDAIDRAVIGVGVNVSQMAVDFPPEIAALATSLAIEGVATTREEVAAEFLNALEPLWSDLQEGGRETLLDAWRARAGFWGRTLRVVGTAGVREGIARDLDANGALVLEADDGSRFTVVAGDIEVAREPSAS